MEKRKNRKKARSVASNVVKKQNFNFNRMFAGKMSKKKSANQKSDSSNLKRNPKGNAKTNKKGRKKHSRLKKVLLVLFLLFFLMILVLIGIFCGIFFSDKFALSREDLLLSKANTIVYDRDGNVIAELSGDENREIISISDMSEFIPKAFVAIEDERFYDHSGVDWKRTLGATGTYIFKGESSYGGSTITQQLVKNITNERDTSGQAGAERKIKEMSRAYQVEKMISKDQILELYLNIIPLAAEGGDVCGVQTASMYYFNKSASELSLEEAAFLAGINHSPNSYNPFRNSDNEEAQKEVMEKIKKRTNTVLAKMKELGRITPEQYETAHNNVEEGLKFEKGDLPTSRVESYFIQAAIDEVVNDLVEEKGLSTEYAKSRVYGGGYRIYTTMSSKVQADLESTYKSDEFILTSSASPSHSQSAMVIMDYTTGQVVGCMGGLGDDVNAIGINRATNITRQPGSSFKPIVTYGCGIEKGVITAGTVYDNSRTSFGKWSPASTSAYSGLCTIRNAIEVSSNTVAAKIMSEIGPDNAIDFARECGFKHLVKASENGDYNDSNIPSMALGGLTYGVSPLEMAAAYSMIGNNGVYIEPTFYTKVEDSSGVSIIETKQESKRIMSEQNAYIMKSLLKQPVEGSYGTATNCRISGIDVGAKTGTTDAEYDRWLCGLTPYYAAATWYGYDNEEGKVKVNGSGNYAAKVWINVMRKVHEDLPEATFTRPSGIVDVRICRKSGCKATDSCSDTYTEIFAENSVPGTCSGHSLRVCDETGLLATEYCPSTHYLAFVPEKERNPSWKTSSSESYSAPSETCNVHTGPANGNNNTNKQNGGDVTVTVSSDVEVPDVSGMSVTAARNKLKEKGLSVEVSPSDAATGEVVSQYPVAGKYVEKNSKVTITVKEKENKPPEGNDPDPTPSNGGNSNTTNQNN